MLKSLIVMVIRGKSEWEVQKLKFRVEMLKLTAGLKINQYDFSLHNNFEFLYN